MRETMTPPQLARRWGIKVERIHAWIHAGELIAINLASDPNGGRPRYHITIEEVARFEQSRSTKPPEPKPTRRRRSQPKTREWI